VAGVLVAGGTGGLGLAVVKELLDAGWAVTAPWVVERERDRVEASFPPSDHALSLPHADLMEPEAVEQVVAEVDDLRAVVNLVGGYKSTGKVHESDPADFEELLRLNLRPGYLLARAAIPRMIEAGGGAFVGVSARAALRPFSGAAAYVTAKAGVLAFVQALDAEYKADGIRCNAILPSVIDTPGNRAAQPDADYSKWVPPEEIARVIRFLISDDAAPTTGAAIPVYGLA
jgi:NAD(P)-dependent dehydrogenase (short-subunit alcohol dehydrogenase family)